MVMIVNEQGYVVGSGVQSMPRPNIEHGAMNTVSGIIVHQTDSSTAESSLNSYLRTGANGAHFLIDKDGTIYQTASLKKKTHHVGKLKAKCFETHTCSAAEVKVGPNRHAKIHKIEMTKSAIDRFPSNEDAIGIELVGKCILDPKFIKPGMSAVQIENLRAEKGVFEQVTPAQNAALRKLVQEIQSTLSVPESEVYPHSRVSAKNKTEGTTADWPGKQ